MKGRTAGEPAQFRGLLPEKVVISTPLDPYLPLKALAAYSGLSVRTLRSFIERDPSSALPCYRITAGKLLIRRSEYDAWVAQFRCQGRPSLAAAARDLGLV